MHSMVTETLFLVFGFFFFGLMVDSLETKRELNRALFLDDKMHPTMDDFFDDLGRAWTSLRQAYLNKACQLFYVVFCVRISVERLTSSCSGMSSVTC